MQGTDRKGLRAWSPVIFTVGLLLGLGVQAGDASASVRADTYIECARNRPTGIELTFVVSPGVQVSSLALVRTAIPEDLGTAGMSFELALTMTVLGLLLVGRRSRRAGAVIAMLAVTASAAVLIPLNTSDRVHLDTGLMVGKTYRYRVQVNGGTISSQAVTIQYDGSSQPLCPSSTPTPTATPSPVPTRTPTTTPTQPPPSGWLEYVNRFRAEAGVAALAENSTWSAGGVLHSRYMVKNNVIGHSEDSGQPWFTPEGQAAAQNGNVMVSSSPSVPDEYAIDLWMTGPFHAIGILDPQLLTTGFGSFRESGSGWNMGGTLDVLRGLGGVPAGTDFPLPFPKNGGKTWLLSYGGSETPNPLTSCSGYAAPSGPPILIQLGSGGVTPNVQSHAFSQGNTQLAHCVFDETSYVNPDPYLQSLGRSVLNGRDAVVLIPRQPLNAGKTYTASITSSGTMHRWSFTTTSQPRGLATPIEMRVSF